MIRRVAVVLATLGCGEGTLSAPGPAVIVVGEADAGPGADLDAGAPGADAGAALDTGGDPAPRPDGGRALDPDWALDLGRARPDMGPAAPDMRAPPPDMRPPPPDQGPPAPATCEGGVWTLTVAGQARRVRFDVPPGAAQGAPRVLVLHGNGDTADGFCRTTGLCGFLTSRGALVAAPDGRHRVIPLAGQRLAWDAYDVTQGNEDVALGDAILAEVDRRCGAGPLFVWGHSQGGYFGYMFAMTHDADGAVIGSAADPMPGRSGTPDQPFPVGFVIGTLDFAIDQARASAGRLEAAGHPVRIIEVEGAGHAGYLRGHDPELADFIGLRGGG